MVENLTHDRDLLLGSIVRIARCFCPPLFLGRPFCLPVHHGVSSARLVRNWIAGPPARAADGSWRIKPAVSMDRFGGAVLPSSWDGWSFGAMFEAGGGGVGEDVGLRGEQFLETEHD